MRHILCLSGGKDSTALAIYIKDKIAEMEYVFCDTCKELPETYEYLDKIERVLSIKITRLGREQGFDYFLERHSGFLPSPRVRWCTQQLKIIPLEKYIGNDETTIYIGIRADEDRQGNIIHKKNIIPCYPFKDAGLGIEQIKQILVDSGIGLPEYYRWRSRSGCYFCFFQRKREWLGLLQYHPDLYQKAEEYEKENFTWDSRFSLKELRERPQNLEFDWGDESCLICSL